MDARLVGDVLKNVFAAQQDAPLTVLLHPERAASTSFSTTMSFSRIALHEPELFFCCSRSPLDSLRLQGVLDGGKHVKPLRGVQAGAAQHNPTKQLIWQSRRELGVQILPDVLSTI